MNDYGWPDKAESTVRIVHIGDVVGKPGMRIACAAGKWLKQRLRADVAVINARMPRTELDCESLSIGG